MKNPMVKYESIQEVENDLKFKVKFPGIFSLESIVDIYVIGDKLIHFVLNNDLIYRMAEGAGDISGNWNNYPEESQETIGSYKVTKKGQYGRVYLILWTDDKYTFSLYTPYGVHPERVEELINSLQEVDSIMRPSPIVEYQNLFEAEYAVGFTILVAACMHDLNEKKYYVISGKAADIDYANGIRYRMARGVLDISGDYGNYECKEAFRVGQYHVLAKGNKDLYYTVLWNDGNFSFSLHCPHGIARKGIEKFIQSLSATN